MTPRPLACPACGAETIEAAVHTVLSYAVQGVLPDGSVRLRRHGTAIEEHVDQELRCEDCGHCWAPRPQPVYRRRGRTLDLA